jgi:energy-coupling factor transporter ATP-binding protein EcfA2
MTLSLRLIRTFGPFDRLTSGELPQFAVLVGANGSGKSQLLHGILTGAVEATVDGTAIQVDETTPKGAIALIPGGIQPSVSLYSPSEAPIQLEEAAISILRPMRNFAEQQALLPPTRRIRADQRQRDPTLQQIADLFGRPIEQLLEDEVRAFVTRFKAADQTQFNSSNLALATQAYFREVYYAQRAAISLALTSDRSWEPLAAMYDDLRGREVPWKLAARLLQPFGFAIEGPEYSAAAAQSAVNLVLRDESGTSVSPSHLSGGEKCLVGLAMAQYASASPRFPKLLLLDESFAPLHPTILGKALQVLTRELLAQHNIHALLVTHAPTLVALAPETSLFQAARQGSELRLSRLEKDDCIDLLTADVPVIRFDPYNRRQVIVEAHQDAFVYSRLYQALRSSLRDVSLEFIPVSRQKSDGGCDKVISLVEDLQSKGVGTARGVVDWDAGARLTPKSVHVLARDRRYSLENIMLDPLLIVLLLSQAEETRRSIGGLVESEVRSASRAELQQLVDGVCSKISNHATSAVAQGMTTAEYCGGLKLDLPSWVLTTRGHDYASWVLAAFPGLRKHRAGPNDGREDKLVAAVAANFSREWSAFLPCELLLLFRELCDTSVSHSSGCAAR